LFVLSSKLGSGNITVNALSPGFTETDMLPDDFRPMAAGVSPFNRVGNVQEVADVALFLASDQSRWVTGQNIQANGGIV
jgi:3-oxoacyl-[acyl-carrier protein] reductase